MKVILQTVLLFLTAATISAQQTTPHLARVAGKGMMIFAGEQIPAEGSRVTGYRIERKAGGEPEFRTVTELKPVSTAAEFKKRFAQSGVLLPYPPYLEGYMLDSIWLRGSRSGSILPLGVAGISLPILYGFNIVWMDEQVQPGSTYQYRVTAMGAGTVRLSEPVVYTRDVAIAQPYPLPSNFNQNGINMKWYARGKNKPAHMEVFRSDNKGAFRSIQSDILALPVNDTTVYTIIDSTVTPNQIYDYYLRAYDALGNVAPPTDTIRLVSAAYSRMVLPEQILTSSDTAAQGIRISWRTHNAAMLKKLVLYRSTNSADGFEPVATIPPTDSVYTDVRVLPATSYFYYFEGVMKMDQVPKRTAGFAGRYEEPRMPGTADLLEGDAGPRGPVLSWVYHGSPVLGFQVYRMQPGSGMLLVSGLVAAADTQQVFSFTDTAGRSTNLFYSYAVRAISTSNVTGSFSDTVVVAPARFTTTPAASGQPVAVAEDHIVRITWSDMQEEDGDIAGYIVVRKSGAATDSFLAGRNMFLDTAATPGIPYSYAIAAVNVFGLRGPLSEPVVFQLQETLPVAPSSLTASMVKTGIRLSWQQPEYGSEYAYHVYRYTHDSEARLIGKTQKNEDSYTDTTAKGDALYFYIVRSVDNRKQESADSDEVGIRNAE